MEISMKVPQKTTETYHTNILGKYLKECKSTYKRDTCTLMFTTALFITAKLWNQPRYPTINEWMKKIWYIYHGILLNHKEKENIFISRKVGRTGDHIK
jgi:hypothetical protein